MPYIGKQLVRGQNRKLDDISSGFNGSQTTFTLQVASQNVTVGSALQLWISLGGVIQDPLSDYTIAGNQITFTTAPAASLDFFGVIQGDVTDTNTPGDATVTTSKLSTGLTVNLADGSAATSSLQLGGTDSGLFSSAADKVNVTTGGVERLEIGDSEVVFNDPSNDVDFRVESNGNTHMLFVDGGNDRVGIGTSSPGEKLTVAGKIQATTEFKSESGNDLRLNAGSANRDVFMQVNGSTLMTVQGSTGRVGIGTTSPSNNLDILSTASGATVNARVGSTASSGVNNANLIINNGGTGNATLRFDYESSTNRASIGVPQSTEALFFTTSGSERMRIDSSGRLLIGTTTEGHVSADNFTVADSGHCGITIRSGTTSEGAIYFSDGTSGDAEYRGQVLYDHDGDYMRFSTAVTERLRITSTGRMGLGITTPQQRQHIHEGSTAASVTQYTNSVTGSTANDGLLVGLDSTEDGLFWMKESNNLTFGTSNTERMRINSSGDANIGSSTYSGIGERLCLTGNGLVTQSAATTNRALFGTFGGSDLIVGTFDNNNVKFRTGNVEYARITTGGYFKAAHDGGYVGSTSTWHEFTGTTPNGYSLKVHCDNASPLSHYISEIKFSATAPNNGNAKFLQCNDTTGAKINLDSDGGIHNYQSNDGNLCDEREKKNIVSLDTKWDKVKSWELKKFHYNEDADTDDLRYGVIAQQVEEHCPEVLTDWIKQRAEDAVLDDDGNVVTPAVPEVIRKGIKEQQMMWMAIKALQEAQTRIETLEAKVAALEAE